MLTSVERLLFVRGVPIFQELRDDFLVRLAAVMDEVEFPINHRIFTEGEEGRSLYIVVSGLVKVHISAGANSSAGDLANQRQSERELARLPQGATFGEMSLFDAEPRSASVTTLAPCECLILTQLQLYDAIEETPSVAVNILRLLSRRIRELNKKLNAYEQALPKPESPHNPRNNPKNNLKVPISQQLPPSVKPISPP